MDESVLRTTPYLYPWRGDACELGTFTLYFICPCVDLSVAIYLNKLGRELMTRSLFANRWNTLLLISCWGVKVRLKHLRHLEATTSNFSTLTLHRQNDIDGHYKVTSMVQGLDQIGVENSKPSPYANPFACVWICAWLCIKKSRDSAMRSLFANRCYGHLLTDCLFQRGWVFGL
jgi:hypothetical protein